MIEANIQNISVEEIMEKIKAEISKRKSSTSISETVTAEINNKTHPNHVKFWKPVPAFIEKNSYTVDELLAYDDIDFVKNAYQAILKRSVDPSGLNNNLEILRNMRAEKIQVLWNLKNSSEGKNVHGAQIMRLRRNYIKYKVKRVIFHRIPFIRYFSKMGAAIVKLPDLYKQLQWLKVYINAKSNEDEQVINNAISTISIKINELMNASDALNDILLQVNHIVRVEHENKLTEVVGKITDVDARVSDVDSKVSDINNKVADFGSRVAEAEGKITDVDARVSDVDSRVAKGDEGIAKVENLLGNLSSQVNDHKINIIDQQRRVGLLLEEARKRFPATIQQDQLKNMLTEEDHLLDAMYVAFEDRFRGTRADIKEKLKVHLPTIEQPISKINNAIVLDVGCGRGEWLELLKEKGYKARGLDINRALVAQSQEMGLDVVAVDLLDYMKDLSANSLAAVTGFHIIEHLSFNTLIALFDETLRVLKPGGIAIFETPNPENLLVSAFSFYLDPTHRKPLVPESMRFFFEQRGFCNVYIKRLHKNREYFKPKSDKDFKNKWFYSEMDYAIIGYKQ
jgi:SAM-dependent methyltransferase